MKREKDDIIALCIDQAKHESGYCVMNQKQEILGFGHKNNGGSLKKNKEWVLGLIEKYNPTVLQIEDITLQGRGGVLIYRKLAELVGVYELLAEELGLKLEFIHPSTWRSNQGIKSKKRADIKKEALNMIKEKYPEYAETVTEDEAEAILQARAMFHGKFYFGSMSREQLEAEKARKAEQKKEYAKKAKELKAKQWSLAEAPEWYNSEQTRDEYRAQFYEKNPIDDPTKLGFTVRADYWTWLESYKEEGKSKKKEYRF